VSTQVVEQKLTCIVAASKDKALAKKAQGLFASESMRINLSTDVQGVEVCGALKNVLAIAAGIVEGKGLGSNALAAVVRGCPSAAMLSYRRRIAGCAMSCFVCDKRMV
jgi:glycerol-3-phosphate dehydrogenase (NAD+)